jgi:hypothetical protein
VAIIERPYARLLWTAMNDDTLPCGTPPAFNSPSMMLDRRSRSAPARRWSARRRLCVQTS